jgi:XTP/dITP diphosphohydrolase
MTPPVELPERLVLATGNAEKVSELRALLRGVGVEADWVDLPSPEEDGSTYEENAAIKARAAVAATGRAALGDDAGLEVDALGGAPGLETRRWAESLGGWPAARERLRDVIGSRARFRCALAIATPDGRVVTALGTTEGVIVPSTGEGVGLEPCFRADGTAVPLPSLTPEERGRVHYRAKALAQLVR